MSTKVNIIHTHRSIIAFTQCFPGSSIVHPFFRVTFILMTAFESKMLKSNGKLLGSWNV